MTVISYPTPAFQNLPIREEYYSPRVKVISAITQGAATVVTTTVDHEFVIGQLIRFIIPPQYGIRELNEMQGLVISLPAANQVEINLDTRGLNAFIAASASQEPQIVAIGDKNTGQTDVTDHKNVPTFIPGSFINVSP